MALFPKTPGVYIQEISTLPPSVVAVPTSIPVFIGYTEKVEIGGSLITSFPSDPIRIESMLEYQTIFGGSAAEGLEVTLTNPSVDISIVDVTTDTVTPTGEDFRMFYDMQMYFANGGGPCYIIAVKRYSDGPMPANGSDTITAVAKAEQVDEITLLVAPDALSLKVSAAGRRGIYDAMLAHCAQMQDRFAILDVLEDPTTTITNDALAFRNSTVGANNLSYGASYYPSFKPAFSFIYSDSAIPVDASAVNLPVSVQAFGVTTLDVINSGIKQSLNITITNYGGGTGTLVFNGTITINLGASTTAAQVVALINANSQASAIVVAENPVTNTLTITAITAGISFTLVAGGSAVFTPNASTTALAPDKALYGRIKTALDAFPITLYPSSMMAGIYCSVDTNRGVWKAPANISVALVDSLNRNIKDSDQEGLNVDAVSGKSINAIRVFDGRGILVWGARTLDGNSNEWRYINVRRLFIFAEHSCKLASEFVVFEPNDKNTWIRVKGTISSFLSGLWRDGALAGDKPEQAFFVKVGLGETMTAQDILEGKMIVQIGLAAVRPAEFIILQFEHKLQEA